MVKRIVQGLILVYLLLVLISPFLLNVKAGSTSVTLTPIADAYTSKYDPDTNFGSNSELLVDGRDTYKKRAYLKFDLSSIPSGSVIISAKLKLLDHYGANINICVHRVTGDWSETSITWNNQPGYDADSIDCKTSWAVDTWGEWDVTSLVQGWVDGDYPNYGLVLISDDNDLDKFHSKEYNGDDPQLVIEYVEPNTVTQTITETVTETQTVTETTTVANTTITETETSTITQTITETQTQTETINQTITTTQTINNTVTETVTATVANTTYYTTIYETISPAYGNQTANYYTDLANQLMPLVMVIGVICTMLSLLLSATKGR